MARDLFALTPPGWSRAPRRASCRLRTVSSPAASVRGFTLLETMLALIIVLVGVLAVVQAQRSFLSTNAWSSHSATATYLANELREFSRALPRHDPTTGGLYFTTPGNPATLTGWGPEPGETTVEDINDLDDLDGLVLGEATTFPPGFTMRRRLPGPINAFGEVISEVLWDGSVEMVEIGGHEQPVSMRGWTQIVQVHKVNPYDYSQIVDPATYVAGIREVGSYPLRVTVTILYQGPFEAEAPAVTSVTWVVPP